MKKLLQRIFVSALGLITAWLIMSLIIIVCLLIWASKHTDLGRLSESSILHLRLNQPIKDRANKDPLQRLGAPFMSEPAISLDMLLNTLKYSAKDDKIKGILLELSDIPTGAANVDSIRQALVQFQTHNKFVYAYADSYSQNAYYLASAAQRVFLNPEGNLEFKGLVIEELFFKGLLDKLEIEPHIIRHGRFKSAVEPLISTAMSSENREQLNRIIKNHWYNWLQNIAGSRKQEVRLLDQLAEQFKIQTAKEAKRHNLVDELAYYDQVIDELKKETNTPESEPLHLLNVAQYMHHRLDLLTEASHEHGSDQPEIAVVYAEGDIVDGDGGQNEIGSLTYADTIREIRHNKNIKAMVLRINSPGGSSLASEVIWREVELTKQVKPVIVSMGNLAASGGYYIAAAANKIFAEPTTITGSIGVFGVLFNSEKMLSRKLGITTDSVKTHPFADIGTSLRAPNTQEVRLIQQEVDHIYDTFITRVANGRNKSKRDIDAIGEGRVWLGIDAKKLGLIDEWGGIEDAILLAAKESGTEAHYTIVKYPEIPSTFELLLSEWSEDFEMKAWFFNLPKLAKNDTLHHFQQIQKIYTKNGIYTRMLQDLHIK